MLCLVKIPEQAGFTRSARRATRALIKSCDRQAAYFWKGPKIKILTITVEASARIVPSRVGEVKGDLSVFFTKFLTVFDTSFILRFYLRDSKNAASSSHV